MSGADPDTWIEPPTGTEGALNRLRQQRRMNGNGRDNIGTQVGHLRVLSVDDLLTLPPRDYLLKGVFSPGEISLLVGAKNARKTFLGLYFDYGLAQGWATIFGRRVKQTPTLYVICEGDKGIAKRVQACVRNYGKCDAFHVIAQQIDLLHSTATAGDLHDIIDAARQFGVGKISVDTVSRVMPGGKENSPEDMGTLLGNLGVLRHETGAHITGLHHGTKEDGTNSRGHSILPNGADVILQVEWTGEASGTGTITIGFARDDISGTLGMFRTEIVDLGTDDDGDPITTLLIEEITPELSRPSPDGRKMTDKDAHMLEIFRNILAKHGSLLRPDPDMPLVSGISRFGFQSGLIEGGWFPEDLVIPVSEVSDRSKIRKPGPSLENNGLRALKRRGFLEFNRQFVWRI